ncbi:MAG: FAD:protein FMN transferase [Victivallales bacterium]|nr:FAD:protein FMN transferase [Victivallales bacterium]
MTKKTAILLRIILRAGICLLIIGLLLRQLSHMRKKLPQPSPSTTEQSIAPHNYTVFAFDTQCNLVLWGDTTVTDAAATPAIRLLTRLHDTLNRYDDASELAHFNAAPVDIPFACSDLLWEAFIAARNAWQQTDGVFDVTIGPLMAFWKQTAASPDQSPSPEALDEAQSRVGFEKLVLDEEAHTVTKTVEGMSVDFGGLAKGLALDMVRPLLSQPGISRMLLDFGGNLFIENPNDLPNAGEVLIRDPRAGDHTSGKMLGRLTDANHRCIATSANSERPIASGTRPIGHIMNPRTGEPATSLEQVTAITPRGVDSDVFSTAVFIDGPELARRLFEQCPDTGFILLPPNATPQTIGVASLATGEQ